MKHIKSNILKCLTLCASAALLTTSCDFLEEYSQDTDYVRSWEDLNELLIGDCYIKPNYSNGFYYARNYAQFVHLIADEVEENNFAAPGSSTQDFDNHEAEYGYYTWQQRVGTKDTYTGFATENDCWKKMYKCINIANNVLFCAPNVIQNTEGKREGKAKVTAEAYFLRAYYMFFLVNLYGQPYNPATASTDLGVPIKTEAEVIDIKYGRNTVAEVYEQIVSDLKAAEEEFAQVKTPKKSIYRADITAVYLLLSRVYLYMQDWDNAADYARKAVENHPQLADLSSYTDRFMLANNPENIFTTGGDDLPVMLFYGYKGLRVSRNQYDIYTNNDLRRSQWLWSFEYFTGLTMREKTQSVTSNPQPTDVDYYYMAFNYGLEGYRSEVSSVFWLRSAEAYLNLAEAEACRGNAAEACEALNALRVNRYNKDAAETIVSASGNELISIIRNERRKEFILQGQRWFDLRRYRVHQILPEKISITHDYTVWKERGQLDVEETRRFVLTEDDASWTLPIPQEVLDFNTGMVGNGNQWREYTIVPYHE